MNEPLLKTAEEQEQNLPGETLYDLSAKAAFLYKALIAFGKGSTPYHIPMTDHEADGAQKLAHEIADKLLYLSERVKSYPAGRASPVLRSPTRAAGGPPNSISRSLAVTARTF